MTSVNISNNPNYEYHIPKHAASGKKIKPGLFKMMMEPLRKSMGESIGKKLGHINLSKGEKQALKLNKDLFVSDENNHAETINISMSKKGKSTHALNGISIKPGEQDSGKYVLVFFGMGDCYEKHLDSLKKLSNDTGATVVSFNYRGVNQSTGKANSASDYITDGSAFIDYLTNEKGANSENILLYGHSLGGGVAAQVRQDLKLDSSPIISESSFSTFKEAVKGKEGKFNAWITKKTGWNMNSIKALETVVDKKLGIVVNRRDPTINYEKASLYKKMKPIVEDRHIKIGKKPSKERLDTVDGDLKTINSIKKAGWVKHLRHPHQMVMDQTHEESNISVPLEIQQEINTMDKNSTQYLTKLILLNELVKLNQKYAIEDKKAYEGIVSMIEDMLNLEKT